MSLDTLRRIDAWLDGRELDDRRRLVAYLAELHDAGRAPASAAIAVAAASFRARLADPAAPGRRAARPGSWPATGGPPPSAAAARRRRSAPRTSRLCSPPATGHALELSRRNRWKVAVMGSAPGGGRVR